MSTYLADKAEDLSVEGPSATFTYRRIGPQDGVPLVLLNRFRGPSDWWDTQFLDHLAVDRDVILFDHVGVRYSTGQPLASIEGFTDGAIELLQALDLAQADLLGWSLGGIVAQHRALRRPDLAAVAAAQAQDVNVLINKAGAAVGASFLESPVDDVRREFETNFYGPLLADPRDVAALALDGVETGVYEVLADDVSRQVKAGLAGDLAGLYPQLAK
ncbi:alpha/beta fold hydrolase [Streptomyces sp. NPDC006365]|uniref:alpha/beta fold hydrolase n=1 Tax=Streptomyces sp. NPDC006365 TaxID=3364744 RepID=UPI0036CA0F8D